VKEAKRRGLSNVTTTPPALDAYISKKSLKLFEEVGIFSHREAEARHEIMLETYIKKIQIEARVIGDLAINHILPAAVKYQTILAENITALKSAGMKADTYSMQLEQLKEISGYIASIKSNVDAMVEARKRANKLENVRDKAIAYCDKVKAYFDPIRDDVDHLEMLIDDALWPMAKYRELVTIR